MTCLVGYVSKKKVYIGGDSAGVGGYSLQIRSDEKVFKKGEESKIKQELDRDYQFSN